MTVGRFLESAAAAAPNEFLLPPAGAVWVEVSDGRRPDACAPGINVAAGVIVSASTGWGKEPEDLKS